MEQTLAILKPDTVAASNCGAILAHLEASGFRLAALRRLLMTQRQARAFYAVHRERPFYDSLVGFMTEGPVVAVALEADDAVAGLRRVMGATNPEQADEGTIRALYGSSIERNAIHGSDSLDNARAELRFFFADADLLAD